MLLGLICAALATASAAACSLTAASWTFLAPVQEPTLANPARGESMRHTVPGMPAAMSMPLLAPATERVVMLDNAKAVLIVCVVLYHTAVVYTSADRKEVRPSP